MLSQEGKERMSDKHCPFFGAIQGRISLGSWSSGKTLGKAE